MGRHTKPAKRTQPQYRRAIFRIQINTDISEFPAIRFDLKDEISAMKPQPFWNLHMGAEIFMLRWPAGGAGLYADHASRHGVPAFFRLQCQPVNRPATNKNLYHGETGTPDSVSGRSSRSTCSVSSPACRQSVSAERATRLTFCPGVSVKVWQPVSVGNATDKHANNPKVVRRFMNASKRKFPPSGTA